MQRLASEIAAEIAGALAQMQVDGELPSFDLPPIELRPPRNAEHGDYACSIALQLAKPARRNPLQIAQAIVEVLADSSRLAAVAAAPPGFLNFRIRDDFLRAQLAEIIRDGADYFRLEIGAGLRAQVEYVSANPTGPLTIGRTRGAVIGDTMARAMVAAGYAVEREYYFNNAGNQMANLGKSLRLRYLAALGREARIPDADEEWFYQGEYLAEFAAQLVEEHGNSLEEADWQPFAAYAGRQMFGWIRDSLCQIRIAHDVYFNEQSLYENGAIWETLTALEAAGHTYRAAQRKGEESVTTKLPPATWLRSSRLEENVEDQILVRSNGEPTYTLTDIAYHRDKFARGFDLLINVLGVDHQSEARVVRSGVRALGVAPERLHVLFHQMVRAVIDGVEMKMSTRRGVYDTLDDLVERTSADAVRYHMLARSPNSHLDFDVDRVVQQSNENPVFYIQNAYVRCAGILREAAARGLAAEGADLALLGEAELGFLRKALSFGDQLGQTVERMAPHRIAFFAHELASAFHPVYEQVRVLQEGISEERARARLAFYAGVQQIFRALLQLMGMSAPERM